MSSYICKDCGERVDVYTCPYCAVYDVKTGEQ